PRRWGPDPAGRSARPGRPTGEPDEGHRRHRAPGPREDTAARLDPCPLRRPGPRRSASAGSPGRGCSPPVWRRRRAARRCRGADDPGAISREPRLELEAYGAQDRSRSPTGPARPVRRGAPGAGGAIEPRPAVIVPWRDISWRGGTSWTITSATNAR